MMEKECVTCQSLLSSDYIAASRIECEACENLRIALVNVNLITAKDIFCEVFTDEAAIKILPNNLSHKPNTNFIKATGKVDSIPVEHQDRRFIVKDSATDFFYEIFNRQCQLQEKMGNPLGTGQAGFKEAMLALIVEATEALDEINWKPWKQTQKRVDRESLATEMTDILQFWMNAAATMDLIPEELEQSLRKKWEVNEQRIKDGY